MMFAKVDYIMVNVSDMSRSVAFYRDVLGLPLQFQSAGWSEFQTGATTLALHQVPGLAGGEGRAPAGPVAGACSFFMRSRQAVEPIRQATHPANPSPCPASTRLTPTTTPLSSASGPEARAMRAMWARSSSANPPRRGRATWSNWRGFILFSFFVAVSSRPGTIMQIEASPSHG
jgi:hypothetical protein